ncbi:MAG: CPBP family intramembrane metalloprotease [Saprospiraceae bacterium]|nr:CPBP family intramembrane metalloprotease [Saprospiraceae bacterium]
MKREILKTLDYKSHDKHYYILLLSAPVLITLYRYLFMSQDFVQYFPAMSESVGGHILSYKLQFTGFFLLMFVIPMFHVLFWWKKPLVELGFRSGDIKTGLKFMLVMIIVLVIPFAFGGSCDQIVRTEYPMAKELISNHKFIPGYELFYVICYYIAWEFYFRGYLLFGLKDRYGTMEAILIQTISSCLIHIDKPFAEILGSIPVGIILGFVALKTRSFWYVFIVHATLGVLVDLFIIYYQN